MSVTLVERNTILAALACTSASSAPSHISAGRSHTASRPSSITSLHLTVVNPEGDEPGGDVFDRIELWELSVGAPAESIDLGRLELCIHADPLEPTTEFYARLGFRFVSSPDPRTMRPQVGHIAAEFERLANVLLGRGCGNPA